jgi:hypothetical protein
MPLEIHGESHIFPKSYPEYNPEETISSGAGKVSTESVKFNFVHDVESLWWIIVWIIFHRLKVSTSPVSNIFTVGPMPHNHRRTFFTANAAEPMYLHDLIHASLRSCGTHEFLSTYNRQLLNFYGKRNTENQEIYCKIVYYPVWDTLQKWIKKIRDSSWELKDLSQRGSADAQELGKRPRSRNDTDGGATGRRGSVEGPSESKKQKPGEDEAEANVVEDMARIVCEEWNPRIQRL